MAESSRASHPLIADGIFLDHARRCSRERVTLLPGGVGRPLARARIPGDDVRERDWIFRHRADCGARTDRTLGTVAHDRDDGRVHDFLVFQPADVTTRSRRALGGSLLEYCRVARLVPARGLAWTPLRVACAR